MAGELYTETLKLRLRRAQERMYNGRMTVYVKQLQPPDENGLSRLEETAVIENAPCHISYDTISQNEQAEHYANKKQEIVLYCDPEIEIPEGSKLAITQNGRTVAYQLSGAPAVFLSHQEIDLEIFRERA